jgi:hypothetical protein
VNLESFLKKAPNEFEPFREPDSFEIKAKESPDDWPQRIIGFGFDDVRYEFPSIFSPLIENYIIHHNGGKPIPNRRASSIFSAVSDSLIHFEQISGNLEAEINFVDEKNEAKSRKI